MADTGPTRPPHRHITSLRELEQIRVVVAPRSGEIAAGELDRRSLTGSTAGRMRHARRSRGDPGRLTRRRPERLGMDARSVNAERGQAGADLVHERARPADICLGIT